MRLLAAHRDQFGLTISKYNLICSQLESMLYWSWFVRMKVFHQWDIDDVESFVLFSKAPPESWINSKSFPRYSNKTDSNFSARPIHAQWRPFHRQRETSGEFAQLSLQGVRKRMALANELFCFYRGDSLSAKRSDELTMKGRSHLRPRWSVRNFHLWWCSPQRHLLNKYTKCN